MSSFRPLSLLNVFDKVWETRVKILLSSIGIYCERKLSLKIGTGFSAKRTLDALLDLVRFAGEELGKNNNVLLTFIDRYL